MFDFSGVEAKWYFLVLTVLIVIAVISAIIAIISYLLKKKGESFTLSTRDLTSGAICLAIAYSLSFFGYKMAWGGTITPASIVPIIIYCYYFGFRKGALICTVFMILQLFQNPYIVNPYSMLLDYLLPYLALCLTGIFSFNAKKYDLIVVKNNKNPILAHCKIYIGCVLYIAIRYASHVLAGVLFYAEWAWEGYSAIGYSLAYNSFAIVDFIIAMIALTSLLCSKSFNTFMASNANALQNSNTSAKNN